VTDSPLAGIIKFEVQISAPTRRGRTTLHTFAFIDPGVWWPQIVTTEKQLRAIQREVKARREISERGGDLGSPGWLVRPPARATYPPGPLGKDPHALVPLAPGVDIQAGSLAIILDALRGADRHEVDLRDIKVVVSQLGSYINKFCESRPSARQLDARAALYVEILRRCTTLAASE
jgi:hypothetical protein